MLQSQIPPFKHSSYYLLVPLSEHASQVLLPAFRLGFTDENTHVFTGHGVLMEQSSGSFLGTTSQLMITTITISGYLNFTALCRARVRLYPLVIHAPYMLVARSMVSIYVSLHVSALVFHLFKSPVSN